MSHRNLAYLNSRRIIYRRNPTTDIPTETYKWGWFYEKGTYQCYELFRSKAKITSYKSFKWHILVLWYLNGNMNMHEITQLARFISDKQNGFISISLTDIAVQNIINEVYKLDLETPPKNKLRKIIFKDMSGLDKIQKLKIVGKFIGRIKKAKAEDIQEAMLYIHDANKKITINSIADVLKVSSRTIYRNITSDIRKEKTLLNEEV